jgi:hypothetical protein
MRLKNMPKNFPALGLLANTLSLILLYAFLLLPCRSQTSSSEGAQLGIWSDAVAREWWAAYPSPDEWLREADTIETTLRKAHQDHGLAKMTANPHWAGWMIHARWLNLFPRKWEDDVYFKDDANQKIYASMHKLPSIQRQFLAALVPEDEQTEALNIFCRIAQTYPDDFIEFPALAIAFAIVFDQAFPSTWPHTFVDPKKLPLGNPDPVERFAFLVKCQRAGKLLNDLRKLSVRDLTFVVDSPLEHNELVYAQQVDLGTPERLRALYPVIPYNQSRIDSKRYEWPGLSYKLFDIGKQGGICMDLAFFVSQTGKSQGVPTLLFVGQGLSGEHGWVGFLMTSGKWDMKVARVRGQEYPIGQAYDPQTWQRITDTEMESLVENSEHFDPASFGLGHTLLQWAALNHDTELYPEIIKAARRAMPNDPRPWRLEAEWLENSMPGKEQLLFWNDWIRHFSSNIDLKVKGQVKAIAVLEAMGRTDDAERLRQEIIASTRSKRFDLGITMAADPVFTHLRKREWEEARDSFESVMRRFRSKAGGHLFYNLLQPYVLTCMQEGQQQMAEDALKHLERGFEVAPGSILDNNMKELIKRVRK